jgi:hypothetical protein
MSGIFIIALSIPQVYQVTVPIAEYALDSFKFIGSSSPLISKKFAFSETFIVLGCIYKHRTFKHIMDNNNKTYKDRNKKKVNVYLEAADQNLIKLCKKKKREGYELLYKKYEKYIYKICYYYSQSKEDALDLLQEIYLKIFNSIEKFDDKKSISLDKENIG